MFVPALPRGPAEVTIRPIPPSMDQSLNLHLGQQQGIHDFQRVTPDEVRVQLGMKVSLVVIYLAPSCACPRRL